MQPIRPLGSRPASRRPARRQPAYIYRRRRVVAAIAALLFLFIVSRVLGSCGGDGGVDTSDTTTSTTLATTTTVPAPPACEVADTPIAGDPSADWKTVLVDTALRLPAEYEPGDLVDAQVAGFPTGFKVRNLITDNLTKLREAAAANNTPVGLIAAYRTFEQQSDLYARRERELGVEEAKRRAARAGHSEHQLGLAIDFGSQGDIDVTQAWGETPTGKWLAAHAHEYGFIMSYPTGKTAVTCYDYEPWHFRYVGPKQAAAIKASGLTLREFLWAESKGVTPGG